MRCRYVNKIYMNEGNGFTVALYSTQDTSVPLSARDKYLASRKMIGFTAVGYNLPLTDQIELEMEGAWENGSQGVSGTDDLSGSLQSDTEESEYDSADI